jgi:hypothetical protein
VGRYGRWRGVAAAVLFGPVDATVSDQSASVLVRNAEVNDANLTWPVGIIVNQKTAAIGALGVIVR